MKQEIQNIQEQALIVIQENQLSTQDSNSIRESIIDHVLQIEPYYEKAMSIKVTDVSQIKEMIEAKEMRKIFKEVSKSAESKRKVLKEESLRKGQVIDKSFKKLSDFIEVSISHLEKQEKFIEIKEKEEQDKLELERKETLQALFVNLDFYNLRTMTEEVYVELVKKSKEDLENKAREEERIIQDKLIAEQKEAEEREKQREENERLKKEAQEKEIELLKERQAREAVEKQARDKEEAEQKQKEEEEKKKKAEERKLARMGDSKKLELLAKSISSIIFPEVEDEKAKSLLLEVYTHLEMAVKVIKNYE